MYTSWASQVVLQLQTSASLVLLIKAQIPLVLALCLRFARRHSFPFLTKQAEHFPCVNIHSRWRTSEHHFSETVLATCDQMYRRGTSTRSGISSKSGLGRAAAAVPTIVFYRFNPPIRTSQWGCGCEIPLYRPGPWQPLNYWPRGKNPKLTLFLSRVKKRNRFCCWIWQKSLRESTDYTTEICMN